MSTKESVELPMITQSGIESQPKLPRDTFRSKFGWKCYLLFSNTWFIISWMLLVILTLLAAHFGGFVALIPALSICPAFTVVPATIVIATRGIGLDLQGRVRLLVEITVIRPALDMSKWDIIAADINNFMLKKGKWSSKQYFYNGEECFNFFKKGYLTPSAGISRSASSDSSPESDQKASAASEASRTYMELKPYADKAVQAYFEDLEAHWQRECEAVVGSSSILN